LAISFSTVATLPPKSAIFVGIQEVASSRGQFRTPGGIQGAYIAIDFTENPDQRLFSRRFRRPFLKNRRTGAEEVPPNSAPVQFVIQKVTEQKWILCAGDAKKSFTRFSTLDTQICSARNIRKASSARRGARGPCLSPE